MADEKPKEGPKIKERFIYTPIFKGKKVRMLNADGHLDYAHQMGVHEVITEFIRERETEDVALDDHEKPILDSKGDPVMLKTRWALFKATVVIDGPKGYTVKATAYRETSSRDSKAVHDPWHLLAVAETRAIKSALASACCITEELINPLGKAPLREAEDIGLDRGDEPNIPQKMRTKADITPPLSKEVEHTPPGGDEWDLTG